MKNTITKLILTVALLASLAWFIFPVQDKIRLGRDLRGGVSLIYSVNMEDQQGDRAEILQQTIEVLKDRVNPTGQLDIAMEPLGLDRIEVVMPLPNETVLALKTDYEDSLDALLEAAEIRSLELDEALRGGNAINAFGGEGQRGQKVAELQGAFDTWKNAQAGFEAIADGGDQTTINRLASAAASAEIRYEDLRGDVLSMSLDRSRLLRTLQLPTQREAMKDEDGKIVRDESGEEVKDESQRDLALADIRSEFPHLASGVDGLVEKYDAYQEERTSLDDPQDLIRLLQGAGVLEFRIAVTVDDPGAPNADDMRQQLAEVGPENTDSPVAAWFEINDLKQWADEQEQLDALLADPPGYFAQRGLIAGERDGTIYLLLYTTEFGSMTHQGSTKWAITGTMRTADSLGRPAVGFQLDPQGGGLMGALTGRNIGKPMAIVLDGEVFSAPTLQSQISTNGVITGSFSTKEINYLIRVLAAGSLEARLSPAPIAQNSLGPSIGADNLDRGLEAFVIAVIAVAIFMIIYYFFAGVIADIALLANGIIIFGFMAMIDGTFTLPGLAGIVLTIGMAVDANVLIYERIREELFDEEGVDLRIAIKNGYAKALSTIVDANVTNLIVCFVLFKTATTEVKGFALTLSIGICATLFTALFLTRQIYYLYTDHFGFRKLNMLPVAFPAVHRALEPSIDWIGLRRIFWPVSTVLVLGSIMLVSIRGVNMFDTELRGGISATMRTKALDADNEGGEHVQLVHTDVEERIKAIADTFGNDADATRAAVAREFANALVLTVGSTGSSSDGELTADRFQVKIANPKEIPDEQNIQPIVVDFLVSEFEASLDVIPPLTFDGDAPDAPASSYTFPIEEDDLGEVLPDARGIRVPAFLGGVAVVLQDVEPAVSTEEILRRVEQMRNQPDFSDSVGRTVGAYGVVPADPNNPEAGYSTVIVTVADQHTSYFDDADLWDQRLATREWALVASAMRRAAGARAGQQLLLGGREHACGERRGRGRADVARHPHLHLGSVRFAALFAGGDRRAGPRRVDRTRRAGADQHHRHGHHPGHLLDRGVPHRPRGRRGAADDHRVFAQRYDRDPRPHPREPRQVAARERRRREPLDQPDREPNVAHLDDHAGRGVDHVRRRRQRHPTVHLLPAHRPAHRDLQLRRDRRAVGLPRQGRPRGGGVGGPGGGGCHGTRAGAGLRHRRICGRRWRGI